MATAPMAPTAEKRHVHVRVHGDLRIDPYHWLRDRDALRERAEFLSFMLAPWGLAEGVSAFSA